MISTSIQTLSSYALSHVPSIYGLYCVCDQCLTNRGPQIRYIGTTTNGLEYRLYQHLRDARLAETQKLSKSMWVNKHGSENVRIVLIEETTVDRLEEREKYWIGWFRTFRSSFGLNMTEGGGGVVGYIYTEEQRKAISDRQRGRKPPEAAILAARTRVGTKSHLATSDEETVEKMKRDLWNGEPPSKVAEKYGMSKNFMNHLNNGRTWSHVPWPIGPRQRTRSSELRSVQATGRKHKEESRKKMSESIKLSWTEERRNRASSNYVNSGLEKWNATEQRKEISGRAQSHLTDEQVRDIRQRHAAGEKQAAIALEFGVSPASVYRIVNRKSHKWVD